MSLDIHKNIVEKFNYFVDNKKTPNIIFHGPTGGGKRTLASKLIGQIYNEDKKLIRSYVMYVNCAHGKGIKFVRDDLKFFAKTHLNINGTGHFKTIVLSNADKLTIDAQSALRRCIEVFNHTTRFFIIVEEHHRLLKPILSRFCEIYVPLPMIKNMKINLHEYNVSDYYNNKYNTFRYNWLKKRWKTLELKTSIDAVKETIALYEKGYAGIDIAEYVERELEESNRKYAILITYNKVKREFRNEKLLILFLLNFIYLRSDFNLENISFM